ncbi:hypothetical protein GF380_02845 [Candidatus Uhrbacteria bacterium]|nr:hypothetical protein [Candidatus Uhrbacteria bacterium]MBD3284087.1 hypothetical protein [Candidatus Uhrbacteria bacterium]
MRLKWILITLSAIAVIVVVSSLYLITLWGAYSRHWEGPAMMTIANVLPIPAARFSGQPIRLSDYLRDVRSIETFLSSEDAKQQGLARPLTMEDRKQALDRLLKEQAIEELAYIRKVDVTPSEIDEAMAVEFNTEGAQEQDFEQFLQSTYGWSIEDFKQHVVRPALLTRKLAASYAVDHGNDPQALERYLEERITRPDVIRYIRF